MLTSKTSSTVAVHSGEHLFRVTGHSQITGDNAFVTSDTFRVGGHDWAIRYYPNGDTRVVDGQFASVFLRLSSACESEITLSYSFCLQDPATPGTGDKYKCSFTKVVPPTMPEHLNKGCGNFRFVSRADLAASGCLKDDCLVIKCTVNVTKLVDDAKDDDLGTIIVPPSNLSKDLHSMLGSGLKEDLTVDVGGFTSFKAHACVLRARSPVFRAQLCNPASAMQSTIRIEDVDAHVFEALLHYMYNDRLPTSMEEATQEATKMARQLLAVAHRYEVERLKLLCESKLSKALDVSLVGFALDVAEQYHCQQLKDCCLKYMAADRERLQAIIGTQGFQQLNTNHPRVVSDILAQVVAQRLGDGK
jgi:speckle-type POZ protein